jgi:Glycosyl hydrolase family 76
MVLACVCAASVGAQAGTAARPPATPAGYLGLAEADLARTQRVFWNPQLAWYDQRLSRAHADKPLASLWSVFPLFEALDAVAIADPTSANKQAVRSFAAGAERYFNPGVPPDGAFDPYPGTRNPRQHTYFDDNGWFELAYLDAYAATGDRPDLIAAEKAFRFIARAGWDPVGGGTWWETLHRHKTAEPLVAEIYGGYRLYEITHQALYLDTANTFLHYANTASWNSAAHLVGRSATDGTVLDYVEGLMIGGELERCAILRERPCAPAEQLARASLRAFPHYADWTPAADLIYLRFLLDLYREDRNPAWYDLVQTNARSIVVKARSSDGLFFKGWDGRRFPTRLLQPNAATLALFAWYGGTAPPARKPGPKNA